jgi:hypothetical protein
LHWTEPCIDSGLGARLVQAPLGSGRGCPPFPWSLVTCTKAPPRVKGVDVGRRNLRLLLILLILVQVQLMLHEIMGVLGRVLGS